MKFCDILHLDGKESWCEMIARPKYRFKKSLRKEFIRGYRFDYLAEQIGISYSYLLQILRGCFDIDPYLVRKIMLGIGYGSDEIDEKLEYFFTKIK